MSWRALQQPPTERRPRDRLVDRVQAVLVEGRDLLGERVGVDHEHLRRALCIDEAQLPVLGEGDDDLGVGILRVLVGFALQRARFAEIHHQGRVAVEHDQEIEATPGDPGDLHGVELCGEGFAVLVTPEHLHARRLDRFHLLAHQVTVEFSANRFDSGSSNTIAGSVL